ncbi:class I SAM-dependent methyltransferase [Parasphingopyxis algicola]|uniref:class I SAM-dependent methyltransferase n=1 Tax=Parasphingopyxis algicola TaxID=2026624 RepID=UPI0015A4C2C9|nr:class I SAM-dependent methyltransferase [Parasphingopyxis algicola]QLC26400.1 class I SAM-dependent methyltransferase [Parasphingopyxis algicola]
MTISNQFPDRGKIGPTPAMTRLADESFLDYLIDTRALLLRGRTHRPKVNEAIEKAGIKFEPNHESVETIRELIRRDFPEAGTVQRVFRTTQENLWKRVSDSYGLRESDILRMLDEYDTRGPGSVTWDPDYEYPDYTAVETHLQTGGFVGDMLSGICFDYGTKVFYGYDDDGYHEKIAERAEIPLDGKVNRIMDLACSEGKLTCALKQRFPEAEVWGSDISAGMVRYAHYRAVEQDLDVHFLQKAAEDLDELEPGQFDLITCYLLFHEVPMPVVDKTIENVFRLLRPGGTFWFSDFPTLGNDPDGLHYDGMLGALDSADNSEPYAPEFVRSNVEQRLKDAGFVLRYEDPKDINVHGRVCDKPA